jgi:hypothetical protein
VDRLASSCAREKFEIGCNEKFMGLKFTTWLRLASAGIFESDPKVPRSLPPLSRYSSALLAAGEVASGICWFKLQFDGRGVVGCQYAMREPFASTDNNELARSAAGSHLSPKLTPCLRDGNMVCCRIDVSSGLGLYYSRTISCLGEHLVHVRYSPPQHRTEPVQADRPTA